MPNFRGYPVAVRSTILAETATTIKGLGDASVKGPHVTSIPSFSPLFLTACLAGSAFNGPLSAAQPPPAVRTATATATADGLQLSLSMPAGPHFLGELVPTTITLANERTVPLTYVGQPVPSPCGSALEVGPVNRGSPPYDPFPIIDAVPCGSSTGGVLAPGGRLTVRQLVPLEASGRLSFLAYGAFATPTRQADGTTRQVFGLAPFVYATLPRLALNVTPVVPLGRRISLRRESTIVHVDAPAAALPGLVYQQVLRCQPAPFLQLEWEPLTTQQIREPSCPSYKGEQWVVAVAAPGYAFAAETYPAG